jgi:hypothetical protein
MEYISVQYRDGTPDETFEGESLLATWKDLCNTGANVLYARYRVPAGRRYTPSKMRTYGAIGVSRGEAALIAAEREAQDRAEASEAEARLIAGRDWTYNGYRDSLAG